MEKAQTILPQHTPTLLVELGACHALAQEAAAEDVFALDLFLLIGDELLSPLVGDPMRDGVQLGRRKVASNREEARERRRRRRTRAQVDAEHEYTL